jgi:hypothetical protein
VRHINDILQDGTMQGELIQIRCHEKTTDWVKDRWEFIEIMMKSNRELRRAFEKIRSISKSYVQLVDGYVEYEENKWIRKFNEYYIDLEYNWKYGRAVKKFCMVAESISVY